VAAAVHPTAIVEPGAELAEDVVVGPFCLIGKHARLERGCRLESHAVVLGRTRLGPDCQIFPFAVLGHRPQDMKYAGEESELRIDARTVVREHATLHPGTIGGGMLTRVGADCLLMAGTHVAHDCRIGDHVVMANGATLGGHVEIGDWAMIGGLAAIHQFVRIGPHAMIGGLSGVESDVIPYGSVLGNRACLSGLNTIGMKRRGVPRDEIMALRHAYRILFRGQGAFADRLDAVSGLYARQSRVMEIVDFARAESRRSLCQPRDRNGA
jgi:UDP-N-acetylglucosamine acyltransferase